jgi:MFS family permease
LNTSPDNLVAKKPGFFYGWVVAVAGCFISLATLGTRYCFGIFFKSFEYEFELSRTATSAIFSTYMVLAGVIAVLGGWAVDKYGPRVAIFIMGVFVGLSFLLTSQATALWHLFISYSLLLALGTGAAYATVNSTVSKWFDRKRGLAVGISSSGGGAGVVVVVPFATYLVNVFEWRMAAIILGLTVCLMIAVLSFLMKRDPREIGLLPDGLKHGAAEAGPTGKKPAHSPTGLSLSETIKTRSFWFLWFIWILSSVSVHMILTHTVPHAIDLGISTVNAATVLSVVGVASIAARIITGRISDTISRKALAIGCALLQFGALIWLIWIKDLWMFYVFAAAFGFSWGGLSNQVTVSLGDIFGMRAIATIMGLMSAGWTIGAAIGPTVGGMAFDMSGSYAAAFAISAAGLLLCALLATLVKSEQEGGLQAGWKAYF